MAKKKTVKSAPVKSAGNSEHDYTFKTENMGAYRFDKDCYVSMKVNRTSLDVALGAIIDGETYTTTANLAGGSGGGSGTMIRYNVYDDQQADVEMLSNEIMVKLPAGYSMYIRYNEEEWEPCSITGEEWSSASAKGGIMVENDFLFVISYSYDSTKKMLSGDVIDFKWEV